MRTSWVRVALAVAGAMALSSGCGASTDSPAGNPVVTGSTGGAAVGDANVRPCGNGVLDADEDCDGPLFGSATCSSATSGARPRGSLLCTRSCTFDTSDCYSSGTGGIRNGTGGSLAAGGSSSTGGRFGTGGFVGSGASPGTGGAGANGGSGGTGGGCDPRSAPNPCMVCIEADCCSDWQACLAAPGCSAEIGQFQTCVQSSPPPIDSGDFVTCAGNVTGVQAQNLILCILTSSTCSQTCFGATFP